jgi:AcrR family transcriptional regulator
MVSRKETQNSRAQKKVGRRSGPTRTRAAVLDAARARFASDGYEAATIRAVARDARVDPALVMHFFGSKEGLLFAVLEELSDFAETMLASLAGPRAGRGRRFTRAYFEAWEAPVMGSQLRTLVRAAIGSPRASRAFQEHLAASLARSGISISQHAGLMLAASQLFGIAVVRYIIEVPVLVALSIDELVQRLGPTIDKYLRTAPNQVLSHRARAAAQRSAPALGQPATASTTDSGGGGTRGRSSVKMQPLPGRSQT